MAEHDANVQMKAYMYKAFFWMNTQVCLWILDRYSVHIF